MKDKQERYDEKMALAEALIKKKEFAKALAELEDLNSMSSFENAMFELAQALVENIETKGHFEEFFDACYAISPLAAYHFDDAFMNSD